MAKIVLYWQFSSSVFFLGVGGWGGEREKTGCFVLLLLYHYEVLLRHQLKKLNMLPFISKSFVLISELKASSETQCKKRSEQKFKSMHFQDKHDG